MPAHHEQIGQCAGHDQAMSVLLQPAIAYLGKAEHPLDDPDRMFDPGPHFGLGTVFRPLDLIHDTAVAVAAIDEILGLWSMLPDHRPLAAVRIRPARPARKGRNPATGEEIKIKASKATKKVAFRVAKGLRDAI